MGDLDALTGAGGYRGRTGPAASPFIEAEIATTPATEEEEVYVLIDSSQQRVGPCRWTPRPGPAGPVLPARGDRALVVVSDQGHRHIVWWGPA